MKFNWNGYKVRLKGDIVFLGFSLGSLANSSSSFSRYVPLSHPVPQAHSHGLFVLLDTCFESYCF
jgi:hypothetical protein